MINNKQGVKFSLDDITLIPAPISNISSRSMVNVKNNQNQYPIMIAPMDSVINDDNAKLFKGLGLITFTIRQKELMPEYLHHFKFNVGDSSRYDYTSISLEQLVELNENTIHRNFNYNFNTGILIDIAQGAMMKLMDEVRTFKSNYPNVPVVVGNIANPKSYEVWSEILTNIDSIRCSIGNGSACISACNTGIFYPMGSLIKEICHIKQDIEANENRYNLPKIIADGGVKNFDDIIKLINLGADYVMCGNIFAQSIEACSKVYLCGINVSKIKKQLFAIKQIKPYLYRKYRGMSTKEVQKEIFGKTSNNVRTSEGITTIVKIKHSILKWVENLDSYMKSALSYSNCNDIDEFRGSQTYIHISNNALKSYKK
jgi:GMP reductase